MVSSSAIASVVSAIGSPLSVTRAGLAGRVMTGGRDTCGSRERGCCQSMVSSFLLLQPLPAAWRSRITHSALRRTGVRSYRAKESEDKIAACAISRPRADGARSPPRGIWPGGPARRKRCAPRSERSRGFRGSTVHSFHRGETTRPRPGSPFRSFFCCERHALAGRSIRTLSARRFAGHGVAHFVFASTGPSCDPGVMKSENCPCRALLLPPRGSCRQAMIFPGGTLQVVDQDVGRPCFPARALRARADDAADDSALSSGFTTR